MPRYQAPAEDFEHIAAAARWLHHRADVEGDPGFLPCVIVASSVPLRVGDAVLDWVKTARGAGYMAEYGRPWLPGTVDGMKSSLLGRIMAGLAPHPVAPPTAYGYPWYDPIDDGHALLGEWDVEDPGGLPVAGQPQPWTADPAGDELYICQHPWTMLARHDDGSLEVTHRPDQRWILTRLPEPAEPELRQMGGVASADPAVWRLEPVDLGPAFNG